MIILPKKLGNKHISSLNKHAGRLTIVCEGCPLDEVVQTQRLHIIRWKMMNTMAQVPWHLVMRIVGQGKRRDDLKNNDQFMGLCGIYIYGFIFWNLSSRSEGNRLFKLGLASYSWNEHHQNTSIPIGSCRINRQDPVIFIQRIRPGTSLGRAAENSTTLCGTQPGADHQVLPWSSLPSPSMWRGLHCLQMFIVSLFRDG